ncbi:MAG TPA: prepilin peptidase, partial [Gemmatales bacterium]|nr:prepilin peptidase [Gemmatales bacterium]
MRFFPGMEFGWCFYTLLLTGLAMLVYSDLRRQRLPNLMTMPLLLAGLLMNLVRAGWLGAMGEPGRYFGWTGVASGLLEGFCFSLAGFFIAFILFTSLWQFQTCGAGDVKLMAALGVW